jgi:hypothetical protein
METWKKIEGYDNKYSVSNFGNVRYDKTNRILKKKIYLYNYDYEFVLLKENNKYKEVNIEKLIVNAFIKNRQVFKDVYYNNENKFWIPKMITEEGVIIELREWFDTEEAAEYRIDVFCDYDE